jgi:Na+/proline symporter
MCRGGVGSILVMFDMLDCVYIVYVLATVCILYTWFGGSLAGEVDKT